jgi:DNA-binding NtrC family response regulator
MPPVHLRVLLVDDDSLIRWALGSRLIQQGCLVVEEQDGASAIRAVTDAANLFDVILIDDCLPDSRGPELLTALGQIAPHSGVVVMSAGMPEDELIEAVRRGTCAFLPKPFDLDEVWALMRRYGRPAGRSAGRISSRWPMAADCCSRRPGSGRRVRCAPSRFA